MPRPLNYSEEYMFSLFMECGGMFGKISNHPRTQVRCVKTLKRLADQHNWIVRAANIMGQAQIKKADGNRSTLIADYKIEALQTATTIKLEIENFLKSKTDKDGNTYRKLDWSKSKPSELIKAWTQLTNAQLELLGEPKQIIEVHHIVEEKMTVIMELVFKTIQQVADEKIIDDNAVRRIFELCGETVTAKALGLEGSGGDTD